MATMSGACELGREHVLPPYEEQAGLGVIGEEIEAGGNGDPGAMVPAHRVDRDDGAHCSECNEAC
jgi:hypothetical protein